jgi:hypothetical protein
MVIAAPSPFYATFMLNVIEHGGHPALITAGVACSVVWALVGYLFLAFAQRSCGRIVRAHERALADADRRLAEEDAQRDQLGQSMSAAQVMPPPVA